MNLKPISKNPAEIAQDLGHLLSDVQAQAKVSGKEIAHHAGHEQSWWAKLARGKVRSVDIEKLKIVSDVLQISGPVSLHMLKLGRALNEAKAHQRIVFLRQGSTVFVEHERCLFSEIFLRISSPDRVPIQLWCSEFAEALTANLCSDDRRNMRALAERWQRRHDAARVRFSWVIGEAALRKTYGLAPEVLDAQLTYMEQFTGSASSSSMLGIVPFDANLRAPMRELRITQNRAALDLFTGVVQFKKQDEYDELLAEFISLPAKRGKDALALLRDARAVHLSVLHDR